MSRQTQWKDHGTVSRYRQGGCDDLHGGTPGVGERCPECKAAMSEWNSLRLANGISQKDFKATGNVRSINDRKRSNSRPAQSNSHSNGSNIGATEKAVLTQLEPYRAEQPVRVELALSSARILDNPDRVNIHDKHAKILEDIVGKLTAKKKTKSGGRLATVSAMAGRRSG